MRKLFLIAALFAPLAAHAAAPPRGLEDETGLIFRNGARAISARRTSFEVPSAARAAWSRFRETNGSGWRAYFDRDTAVPGRLYGGYVEVPGSMTSPAVAERATRELLERHVDLLAPGASAADFQLVSNVLSGGMRVVGFVQTHRGMPVEGGQLSFRFKKDRLFVIGSEAWPHVSSAPPARLVDAQTARRAAEQWLQSALSIDARASTVSGPMILPLPPTEEGEELPADRVVLEVRADSRRPIGRWAVYLDAASGEPVARRQTLKFASGTIRMNTPERWPGARRYDAAAAGMDVIADTARLTTDQSGVFTWPQDQGMRVRLGAVGPLVQVINTAGTATVTTASVAPGGTFVWNAARDEMADAQLVTYVASQTVKAKARQIAPELGWLTTNQLPANVNIDDLCNAFSDGDTVNFFRAGGDCENTGRLPDVVYHEFGHALHFHSIIQGVGRFDSAFSEGLADYLAGDITNDQGMGRGFFFDDRPLRELDPVGSERVWPDDVARDPHETGLIFGGAMWDLRKALIAELGQDAGAAEAERLYYGAVQRAADIPSTYIEVLATDDDDGNLANGTPRLCTIADAFGRHGLGDPALGGPGLGSPILSGLDIKVPVSMESACPGNDLASAVVTWEIRGEPGSGGTIDLEQVSDGYATTIPAVGTGIVVRYRLDVSLVNGTAFGYPENPADPMYEVYVGPLVPIFCSDLESDPVGEGWTHELLAGDPAIPDEWELGTPQGLSGSGDPSNAHSGDNVYGTDLGFEGENGRYSGNRTVALHMPMIDVSGYSVVRLQYYRWLTVQDGFYDHARITANGMELWSNVATMQGGTTNHLDSEWRFQDVDASAGVIDGWLQVSFELQSDRRRSYGGWNVDDLCIMGVPSAVCGNNMVEPGEACDDGNTTGADGCEADCTMSPPAVCGNGTREQGEACDDGNTSSGDGCESNCTMTPPAPVCGNGFVEAGEACDDGRLDGVSCSPGCVLPGSLQTSEGGSCGCTSTRSGADGLLLLLALALLPLLSRRASVR